MMFSLSIAERRPRLGTRLWHGAVAALGVGFTLGALVARVRR
jgi:hypothetical protein